MLSRKFFNLKSSESDPSFVFGVRVLVLVYFSEIGKENETFLSVFAKLWPYEKIICNFSEFLVDNFVNSNAKGLGYTCEILDSQWSHGTVHSVVGSDQSGQGLEAVDACRDTQRYKTALTNLPAEYFFEPTKPNGYFVVINGSQDPLFGEYENAFSDSISFR